jgi:hypothetical protein
MRMRGAQLVFMMAEISQGGDIMIIQLLILFLVPLRFNMVIKENMI